MKPLPLVEERSIDLQTIIIERIPTPLYENWLEITTQLMGDRMPQQEAMKVVYGFLQKYLLAKFPVYKLCAFDELNKTQAKKLGIPNGMYVKLRRMEGTELSLALSCDKEGKGGKDGNPRWILETEHIADLELPEIQKQLNN